jgi:LCP family protein required for cell wall assembly
LRLVSTALLRRLGWRFVFALVLCAVLVTVGITQVNRMIDDEVAKLPRVDVQLASSTDTGVNYLIVGSDSRAFVGDDQNAASAFGTESDSGPPKSDTLMVLHADGEQSYAVSFPRDLWVDVAGHGKGKINSALNDGPQNVVDTIQQNFDLKINHYVQVDFQSFKTLVDAIGGISVWVPYASRNDHTGFGTFGAGCWPLNGDQALAYVRSRAPYYQYLINNVWVQADPIPDIGRIERQQKFVKKLARHVITDMTDDPLSARDLADKVVPDLTVDKSFDRTALNQLARSLLALRDDQGLTFDTLPWTGGRAQGQDVLFVDEAAAKPVLDRLRGLAALPAAAGGAGATTTTAPAIRPADVRVKVLNASGQQGAAGTAATDFQGLGFVNGGSANDPRGLVDHSEVRYKPGDDAKAALVATHVANAQLVSDSSLSGSDVVVVLGKNFTAVQTKPVTSGSGTAGSTGSSGTSGTTTSTTAAPLSDEAACDAN